MLKTSRPPRSRCAGAPSMTRTTQPRQAKSRSGSSLMLLAEDAAEIEPDGFLELSAGARRGLRVFELVDVDGKRHALPLDAVELRGEAAPFVRLREHELGAIEAAVFTRELLHDLGDE